MYNSNKITINDLNSLENLQLIRLYQIEQIRQLQWIYNPEQRAIKNRMLVSCDSGCVCQGNKCTGCKSHYYNDGNGNKLDCKQCNSDCLECNGDDDDDCTSCKPGYVLNSNQECDKCDLTNGYYISSSSCKQCDNNCKTCYSKSTTCTSCKNSLTLDQQAKCVDCSKDGYFKSAKGICTKCNDTCATCSGEKDNECLSCPPGSTFVKVNQLQGSCVLCNILNGYYLSGSLCLKCHSSCKTCDGQNANNCLSCINSNEYLKLDKTCSPCDLSNKYFIDSNNNNTCTPCSTNCQTCKNATVTGCKTCIASNYLYADGSCSLCLESGNSKIESKMQCIKCDTSCLTCSNTTAKGCSTCPVSSKLYPDNSCKPCNTDGYFEEGIYCKSCSVNCKKCTGISSTQCTECKDGLFKFPITGSSTFSCGPCDDTSSGFFKITGPPLECQKCDSTCKTCNGSLNTNCTICSNGLYLKGPTGSQLCELCDINNQYYINAGKTCDKCDGTCQKCIGPLTTDCTACPSGKYLKQDDKTCGDCSTPGYFIQQNLCLKCDISCLTCNGTQPNNCLTCKNSDLLSTDFKCVAICPQGTFVDVSNKKCLLCHPSCETCTEATKCDTCKSNTFLLNDLCVQCPETYFGDADTIPPSCQQCDISCKTCNNSTTCLTCYEGTLNDSSKCDLPCAPGQFKDLTSGICSPCSIATCKTCYDGTPTGCLSCQNGLSFKFNYSDSKTYCVSCSTEDKYFQLGNDCLPCDTSCQTCNEKQIASACLSCMPGFFFQVVKGDTGLCINCENAPNYYKSSDNKCLKCPQYCNKCVEDVAGKVICNQCDSPKVRNSDYTLCIDCPEEGFYKGDSSSLQLSTAPNAICLSCDGNCFKCNGKQVDNCLECYPGKYIEQLDNNKQTCIPCGDGYRIDGIYCKPCISGCNKCTNDNECITCKDNFFLHENKTCLGTCEITNGYFEVDDGILQCKKCSNNCLNCTDFETCTKCQDTYSFVLGMNGTSITCEICQVSNKLYIDQSDKFCKHCDSICQTCLNTAEECTTCASPSKYYADKKTCGDCTPGYKAVGDNCEKCDYKCETCDANGCIDCSSGFYLKEDTKECIVCDISNGNYIDNKKCRPCDPKCKTCSSSTELDCIQCADNLFKNINKQCIDCKTDEGNYKDIQNNQCLPCALNCLKCNGPDISQCTQCFQNLYLKTLPDDPSSSTHSYSCEECLQQDGFCINGILCSKCDPSCKTCDGPSANQCLSCPVGTFIIGTDRICQPCPNGDYDNLNSVQKFSLCSEYDIVCQKDIFTDLYTLQIKCNKCKGNNILQNQPNTCIASCSDVGQNMSYNTLTKQCQCNVATDYFNLPPPVTQSQLKQTLSFCTSSIPQGYFCNASRVCLQCQPNCKVCDSHHSCSECQITHFVWFGECLDTCLDSNGLSESKGDESKNTINKCVCKEGYVLRIQDKICVLKLAISSVKLSVSNYNNLITVILNRKPYKDEYDDLSVLVDPKILKLNSDYKILSTEVIDNQIQILLKVNDNLKINQIVLTLNKEINTLTLKNTILTTEEFNKENKDSDKRNENINSVSQTLVPETESVKNVMMILKNIQLLCVFSNFIQVLGPIIIYKESLPPQIFTYSILGASFIFEDIPSYQDISYDIKSESVSSSIHNSEVKEQEQLSNKMKLLQSLGLQKSLYSNFLFPHISLIIVTIIVFLNLFARAIMQGKQYTLYIANTLLNVMSNMNQGYITPAIFSIYFSISFEETRGLAIFQSLVHVCFMALITYVILLKDTKYIEENIPNFLEDINFKAKGGKSYIVVSYVKKYLVIAVLLGQSEHVIKSCIIITTAFFFHGIYIGYYRFFGSKFISYYKVFQEFFIATSFIVLAMTCKKYEDLLQQTKISNDDLMSLGKISLVVFFMLIACLFISFILFIIRFIISIIALKNMIMDRLRQRREKSKKQKLQRQFLLELANENNFSQMSSLSVSRYRTLKFNQSKSPCIKPNLSPSLTQKTEPNGET